MAGQIGGAAEELPGFRNPPSKGSQISVIVTRIRQKEVLRASHFLKREVDALFGFHFARFFAGFVRCS